MLPGNMLLVAGNKLPGVNAALYYTLDAAAVSIWLAAHSWVTYYRAVR